MLKQNVKLCEENEMALFCNIKQAKGIKLDNFVQ